MFDTPQAPNFVPPTSHNSGADTVGSNSSSHHDYVTGGGGYNGTPPEETGATYSAQGDDRGFSASTYPAQGGDGRGDLHDAPTDAAQCGGGRS